MPDAHRPARRKAVRLAGAWISNYGIARSSCQTAAATETNHHYGEASQSKTGRLGHPGSLQGVWVRPVLTNDSNIESIDDHVTIQVSQRIGTSPMCDHVVNIPFVHITVAINVPGQHWSRSSLKHQTRSQGLVSNLGYASLA